MATQLDPSPRYRKALAAFGLQVRTSPTSRVADDPTITAGAGVPSATEPNGSLFFRTDGAADSTIYQRISGAWVAVVGAGAGGSQSDLIFDAATELTIAGGIITATQGYHRIDTQADAASDDLDTINGIAEGEVVIFRAENAARTVVLKHNTGNILCGGAADISLAEANDCLVAVGMPASKVAIVAFQTLASLPANLAADLASVVNAKGASLVGVEDAAAYFAGLTVEACLAELRTVWRTNADTELTIAAGVVTYNRSSHSIDTEADAASDDLDTINGGVEGAVTIVRAENAARTVVLKHATGNIKCPHAKNITLAEDEDYALLYYDGANWIVLLAETLATGGSGLGLVLASVATGEGASKIGVEDAGAEYTGADVEAVLSEVTAERLRRTVADPGDAAAIAITKSGVCLLTSAGVETRTLAIPTFVGQRLGIVHSVDGGSIEVTASERINETGNTVMTFTEAEDFIELLGIKIGANLRWQVVSNDGVVLT